MAKQQKARRSGRPALMPEKRKLPPVGFRPTPGLKAFLDEAAEENGRSVSKEIESRLERSVQKDEAMGGADLYALFRLLGAAANLVEARTGKAWSGDWETFLAVKAAWDSLIAAARPPTPKGWKDKFEAIKRKTESLEREERKLTPEPTMPTMKMLPGQGYFNERSEAQLKEDEKALADYHKQMRKSNRDLTALLHKRKAHIRLLEGQRGHFDELAELGEGVAAGLLRPEGDK